jgi:hypothetical protein
MLVFYFQKSVNRFEGKTIFYRFCCQFILNKEKINKFCFFSNDISGFCNSPLVVLALAKTHPVNQNVIVELLEPLFTMKLPRE